MIEIDKCDQATLEEHFVLQKENITKT
jgi:hypothetical protein